LNQNPEGYAFRCSIAAATLQRPIRVEHPFELDADREIHMVFANPASQAIVF
jgi:hypothetical protein